MPRKVLLIHHGGGVGGASVSMLQLAAALDRRRFQPLAVFTEPGPILDYARELGVPARVFPLRSTFSYGAHVPLSVRMLVPFFLHFWPTVRAAQALVRQERPDLVHLNTSVLVPAAIGVKRERVPLIWHVREVPGPNRWLRRWHTGTITRLADCVIVTSNFVRRAYDPSADIRVVYNSVEGARYSLDRLEARMSTRAELGLPSTAPVVGMIGSIQAVKGHSLLLAAARVLVAQVPEVRFLIVAGGADPEYRRSWKGRIKGVLGMPMDNLEQLQRKIRAAGLESQFIFTGYRRDIPEVIAAMDLLAFLSLAPEGFGRPLIEAMAMGCPVVATDVGPTREIVGDEAALMVMPGDASGLADAITRLLRDRELAQQLGDAGRRRALEHFQLDQMSAKVQDIYERVFQAAGESTVAHLCRAR